MKEALQNRRVKFTIAMLKDALVESMLDEHISKISVKSLCDRADINRSTFYANFKDQYALLGYIEQEALDNIKRYLEEQDYDDRYPVSFQVLHNILIYVGENSDLFKVLLSENCEQRIQREVLNLTEVISFQLNSSYSERVKDYLNLYATTGCISILHKWLQDDKPESTKQLTEHIMQMLYSGMSSFE